MRLLVASLTVLAATASYSVPHQLLSPWESFNAMEPSSEYQDKAPIQQRALEFRHPRRKRHIYGSSKKKGNWRNLVGKSEVEINPFGDRTLQSNTAMTVCQAAIPLEEQVGQEFDTRCTCSVNSNQQTATLECKDTNCAYCNTAETVCTGYSYGVIFDKDGLEMEFFEEDVYTKGRSGAIRYTETDGGCSLSIGGTKCSQCVTEECDDGYFGINVTCTNIESGTTYNSCKEGFSTSGILEAYNEEEFGTCFGSPEICQMDSERVDDRYECYCDTNSTLQCMDKCEYCDDQFTVCGQESLEHMIQSAVLSGTRRTINYTAGRSETLIYEESNCSGSTCANCTMKVNGVECNTCSIQACTDGKRAPQINCGNIDASISETIDFCVPTSLSGHVLQYMETGFTETCTTKSQLACREAKVKYEQHEHQFACACVDQINGTLELQCNTTCGDLCNNESTVCVRESFHQDILNEGASSFFRKNTKYTIGRKETLSYVEFVNGTCSMTIDDVGCQSCQIKICEGNTEVDRAPVIDCSAFEGGAVLDLCKPNITIETGIFERFSMDEFQGCLDHTPTNGVCETSLRISELPHSTNGTTLLIPYDGSESCGSAQSFAAGLWYTIVGTGAGIDVSLCETKADFDAHISIFTGTNCDSVRCLAASENDCKVEWLSEEGVNYYIRVHGIGGELGNFGLSVKEVNMGLNACAIQKALQEENLDLTTSCICKDPEVDGYVHLDCSIGCSTCDATGSVCANRTDSKNFDKGGRIVTQKQQYRYTMGRTGSFAIEKSTCTSPTECDTCEVSIDDVVCTSCTFVDCADGSSTGVTAVCSNATINTCESPIVDISNILHPLVDSSYDECFYRDSLVACEERRQNEQNIEGGITCDCQDVGDTGDARLVCKRQFCLRCNNERTICGYDAFGVVFDGELGRLTGRFEGFQYVQGRNDLVAYHISNDMSNSGESCLLTLNNDICDSCIIAQCAEDQGKGQFNGISFDCQNVPGGLFYDGCSLIGLPGTFEYINSPAFEACVDVASPREVCEETMLQTKTAELSIETTCACNSTELGGYELICNSLEDCQFCDPSGSICAYYTEHLNEINSFGSSVARVDTFEYISGRDEVVVIHDNKIQCQVTINGEACELCTYTDCDEEGGRSYFIDCSSRLGENATYNCGEGHDVFTVIAKSVQYKCVGDDTASPSVFPTKAPSSRPSLAPTRRPTLPPRQSTSIAPSMERSEGHQRRTSVLALASTIAVAFWLYWQ